MSEISKQIEEWNRNNPIGTKVLIKPRTPCSSGKAEIFYPTETISLAYNHNGCAVVDVNSELVPGLIGEMFMLENLKFEE